MNRSLKVQENVFALSQPFVIARGARDKANVICVEISEGENKGWGESVPYARYNETVQGVMETIETLRDKLEGGMNRETLQECLPAGAARNAIDCALWDLEAKQTGKPVFKLAGINEPKPCVSAYTISLGEPEQMNTDAKKCADYPLLKIKLGGQQGDVERLNAVREGAPNSDIIVDANEGWDVEMFNEMTEIFVKCGVRMVEQPFPAEKDEVLRELDHPLPICADESCHVRGDLEKLKGKYDVVNIKLDKTGGLTEALALRKEAEKCGFEIMVGCMIGSSLSMAPATLVAQNAQYVDLDGPLFLADDREPPIVYKENMIFPPQTKLWG